MSTEPILQAMWAFRDAGNWRQFHNPNGMNQNGCVYAAQGFEYGYVFVNFLDEKTRRFVLNQTENVELKEA
jgi:DUF2075 family protein